MEPVSGSNDSKPERPPVRRNVRQRQPTDPERGRRGAARPTVAPDEPAPLLPPVVVAEDTSPRPCPFCGEEVSAKAVVCRHCQRDLVAATGARLVLTPEKWNTSVPQWMVEEEKQFLKRRIRGKQARSWWRPGMLAAVLLVLLAIVYRLITAPPAPHDQLRLRARAEGNGPVSALAMASADEERARQEQSRPPSNLVAKPPAYAPSGLGANPAETVVTMSASELVRRFQRDHARADDLYKDQLMRLSGRVALAETRAQVPYITLDVPSRVEVRCYLSPGALGKLTRMRPGAQILIQGRCQGWFNNVVLADCDLL